MELLVRSALAHSLKFQGASITRLKAGAGHDLLHRAGCVENLGSIPCLQLNVLTKEHRPIAAEFLSHPLVLSEIAALAPSLDKLMERFKFVKGPLYIDGPTGSVLVTMRFDKNAKTIEVDAERAYTLLTGGAGSEQLRFLRQMVSHEVLHLLEFKEPVTLSDGTRIDAPIDDFKPISKFTGTTGGQDLLNAVSLLWLWHGELTRDDHRQDPVNRFIAKDNRTVIVLNEQGQQLCSFLPTTAGSTTNLVRLGFGNNGNPLFLMSTSDLADLPVYEYDPLATKPCKAVQSLSTAGFPNLTLKYNIGAFKHQELLGFAGLMEGEQVIRLYDPVHRKWLEVDFILP